MDIDEIKNMLLHRADELRDLARRIGEEGRSFNQRERKLIRSVMFQRLEEEMLFIKMDFLEGDVELDQHRTDSLKHLFII